MEGSIPSSNISPPTPSSSASPAATTACFKPRRSEDWNKYRPFIEQLYRNDQLKLKNVKDIMERDHKFTATEKQYKDRLAAWNVRKNIKAKEVNIMIRKKDKRAARGKKTVFRVAGQKVDSKRIERFLRRYGPSLDKDEARSTEPPKDQESPEPSTPSDMSYYTPEPDERPTTLSLSPHPEPETPCEPIEHRLSMGAKSFINHNHQPVEHLETIADSDAEDYGFYSAYNLRVPTVTVPPIADNPQRALDIFNGNQLLLDQQLEKAGLYSIDDSSQQQHGL
ncbi:Clr5 domain-containing protein [Aspergillus unguis]